MLIYKIIDYNLRLFIQSSIIIGIVGYPDRRGKAPVTFCVEENNGGLYWENFVYREDRVDDNMGLSVKDNFYGVDSIPATFIIDKTGIIRDSHVGRLELRELEEKIQPYL